MNIKHILITSLWLFAFTARGQQTGNPMEQKVTFKSEGENMAGKLLLPSSYKAGDKLPVIIVLGPWTQVKEQVQYFYGRKLSQKGYAVLNFDFRYWGESGGKPRSFESTAAKEKDVLNAISYIKTNQALDAGDISMIGVCGGAGVAVRVGTISKDVKRLATVAAWLQHPSTTSAFYEVGAGVQGRIELADKAMKNFQDKGTIDYVEAYNPNDPRAAMFFPLDYYGNPKRGAVPQWKNQFAVIGWKEWMTLNVIDGIAEKINCPLVMVHSDGSALPGNVKKFYTEVRSNNKHLAWLEGEHTQFYDDNAHVDAAITDILKFFEATKNKTK